MRQTFFLLCCVDRKVLVFFFWLRGFDSIRFERILVFEEPIIPRHESKIQHTYTYSPKAPYRRTSQELRHNHGLLAPFSDNEKQTRLLLLPPDWTKRPPILTKSQKPSDLRIPQYLASPTSSRMARTTACIFTTPITTWPTQSFVLNEDAIIY